MFWEAMGEKLAPYIVIQSPGLPTDGEMEVIEGGTMGIGSGGVVTDTGSDWADMFLAGDESYAATV